MTKKITGVDVSGYKGGLSPLPETHRQMDFFEALREVANGKSVTRPDWEKGFYVYLHHNGHLSLHKPDGNVYDLIVTVDDILGENWVLCDA